MSIQRYEWQDAITMAHAVGRIGNGAVLTAAKLANVINWKPRGERQPGLYWKNDQAFETVGLSRTVARGESGKALFQHGFLREERGNWLPCLPVDLDEIRAEYENRRESIKVEHEAARKPSVFQSFQSVACTP